MKSFEAQTAYIADMKAQLKELIDKYHPAIIWFDGDWTYNTGAPTLASWCTKADGIDLYNYLSGLYPNLLMNKRVLDEVILSFVVGSTGFHKKPSRTVLIEEARRSCFKNDFEIKIDGNVYAFDSSNIDLCLSVFWWAEFRKKKGSIKLHTLL